MRHVVTGISGAAAVMPDRSEGRGRGYAPHVECGTNTLVPDATRSEKLVGAHGPGALRSMNTRLVPGTGTLDELQDLGGVGILGDSVHADLQLTVGVRRGNILLSVQGTV